MSEDPTSCSASTPRRSSRWSPTTSSTRPSSSRPSRRSSTPTATSPATVAAAVHPPPHGPLPARARARAHRAGRRLHRRPREALARPEGDARAGHRRAAAGPAQRGRAPAAGARCRGRCGIGIITGSGTYALPGFEAVGPGRGRDAVRPGAGHARAARPAPTCCTSRATAPATCCSPTRSPTRPTSGRCASSARDGVLAVTVCGALDPACSSSARSSSSTTCTSSPTACPTARSARCTPSRARRAAGTGSSSGPFAPALRAALLDGARDGRPPGARRRLLRPRRRPAVQHAQPRSRRSRQAGVTAVARRRGPRRCSCGEAELPYALVGYATDYANGVHRRADAGRRARPPDRREHADVRRDAGGGACPRAGGTPTLEPERDPLPLRLIAPGRPWSCSRALAARGPTRRLDPALRGRRSPSGAPRERACGRGARTRAAAQARSAAAGDSRSRRVAALLAGHAARSLLVAPDVPGLDAGLAAAALGDLAAGCALAFAPATDARPFLLALADARPEGLRAPGRPRPRPRRDPRRRDGARWRGGPAAQRAAPGHARRRRAPLAGRPARALRPSCARSTATSMSRLTDVVDDCECRRRIPRRGRSR